MISSFLLLPVFQLGLYSGFCQTPLILNEVEFTLYDNFPHASVKITDLLILESQKFDGDTLIFAKRAYVNVSLLNIIRKNYTLKTITINDAKINIKYKNTAKQIY